MLFGSKLINSLYSESSHINVIIETIDFSASYLHICLLVSDDEVDPSVFI